jgi:hypothetical protein
MRLALIFKIIHSARHLIHIFATELMFVFKSSHFFRSVFWPGTWVRDLERAHNA